MWQVFLRRCKLWFVVIGISLLPQEAFVQGSYAKDVAIYFDPNYPSSWSDIFETSITVRLIKTILELSTEIRPIICNASQLRSFMEQNPEGIVIITQGVAPGTIWDGKDDSFIEKWLRNGGRMIWSSDWPFYYIGHNDGSWDAIGERGSEIVFGFQPVNPTEVCVHPTQMGGKFIPTLDEFICQRGVDITRLEECCAHYEIFGEDHKIADPVLFSPRGWNGEFVMLGMNDFYTMDVEQRVSWISELLISKFGKSPDKYLTLKRKALSSLVEVWKRYAYALNVTHRVYPERKDLVQRIDNIINSIDVSLATKGKWREFNSIVKSADQKLLEILEKELASGASPGATISGKVTSKLDDKPIQGAKVKLGKFRTTTDESGLFKINILELKHEGEQWLWVSAEGFATELVIVHLREGQRLKGFEVKLNLGADIFGRVVDKEGKSIEGTSVWTSIGTSVMPSVKTDKDGSYILKGLNPLVGKYCIIAEFTGYESGHIEIRVEKPGKLDVPGIMLNKIKTGTIIGKITDLFGTPIPSAEVEAGVLTYMDYKVGASADKNGNFKIKVHEGEIYIASGAKGFAPSMKTIYLNEDETKEVNLKLSTAKSISGRVIDKEGKPIEGAYIFLNAGEEGCACGGLTVFSKQSKTDKQGFFKIEDLPDKEVMVTVLKEGYADIRGRSIKAGSESLKFVLEPTGRIAGKVLDAQTLKPIKHFVVKFDIPVLKIEEGWGAGIPCRWVEKGLSMTDEKGEFSIPGLQPGALYKVIISAEGYTPYVIERFIARADFKPDDLVIKLEKARLIEGVVFDPEGNLLPDVRVGIFSRKFPWVIYPASNIEKPGWKSTMTAQDGGFSLEALPEEFYISAEHPDFAIAITGPFKFGDFPERVEIRLKEGGKVEGYVFSGKRPVEGTTVQLQLIESSDIPFKPSIFMEPLFFGLCFEIRTQNDGSFSFGHLIPGKYQLSQIVWGKSFSVSVRMATLNIEDRKIVFQPLGGWGGATVKGVVTDEKGKPVDAASVKIIVRDNRLYSNVAVTDENGYYEMNDIPPGTHDIWAEVHPRCVGGIRSPGLSFYGKIEIPEGKGVITFNIKLKRKLFR
ncbi:MAG: carboxypeptidase regulatory-like domain-containing protein [bacterium]|nr:carboxypeptidase regulatory-like domain-containing protein [bacterium]